MTALDDEAQDRSLPDAHSAPAFHASALHPRFAGRVSQSCVADGSGLALELTPCDQILRKTRMVALGRHRCAVEHPRFARGAGPFPGALIAFRRTSVRLRSGRAGAEVVSPNHVTLHNPGEGFAREAVSADGDDYDWLALAPAFVRELLGQSTRTLAFGRQSVSGGRFWCCQ